MYGGGVTKKYVVGLLVSLVITAGAAVPASAAITAHEPQTLIRAEAGLTAHWIRGLPSSSVALPAVEDPGVTEPELSASYAALIDARTGRLLYARQHDEPAPPASTTKILTALVAYESLPLRGTISVPAEAEGVEGSSIYLEAGEEKTVEELLYGLMLHSGNDAAVALALAVSGDLGAFAARMNRRARLAGARQTTMTNPHGLPDPEHLTTAYDLALISADALRHPPLARIVATERHNITWPQRPYDRLLLNNNRLLENFDGADGVKTGWTRAAGRCVIASATRDGHQLIAVLLDAPHMWDDAETLLQYGFDTFAFETLARAGSPVDIQPEPRIIGGIGQEAVGVLDRDLIVPLAPGERQRLGAWVQGVENMYPPVPEGAPAGRLTLTLDGRPLSPLPNAQVELSAPLAQHPVQRIIDRWLDLMRRLMTHPAQFSWLSRQPLAGGGS